MTDIHVAVLPPWTHNDSQLIAKLHLPLIRISAQASLLAQIEQNDRYDVVWQDEA